MDIFTRADGIMNRSKPVDSRVKGGGSFGNARSAPQVQVCVSDPANYSLIAVSNALEPLRMANRLVGKDVYEWSVVSLDGQPTESSSGLKLSPAGYAR
jgi:transcriptional regulator GlxA family with amidase domain